MSRSDDDQNRSVRVIGRTVVTVLIVGLCAAGCASAPKNERGEPLTYRLEVVNNCGTNMRFYVDRETFWRASTMDAAPILQNGQAGVRFLKPGKHKVTLLLPSGTGSGRRVEINLQGPMHIRGC